MNEQIVSLFLRLGSELNASLNPTSEPKDPYLSVGLGNTLQFVLLLDSVAVGGALGSIDELVGEAFGDGLNVPKSRLPGSSAEQPDGLVDSPEGGDVHSLTPHSSSATDAGRVLTWARVNDGVHNNLERVLSSQEMDNLKGVLHNSHG